jgi:hypothetical protein
MLQSASDHKRLCPLPTHPRIGECREGAAGRTLWVFESENINALGHGLSWPENVSGPWMTPRKTAAVGFGFAALTGAVCKDEEGSRKASP